VEVGLKVARVAAISKVLAEEGLGWLTSGAAAPDAEPGADVAARVRRTLERLGPTFVKFGQMLSTRVDLFPAAFLAELAKLQASVPPFPTAEARAAIERELGRPVDEVFADFPDAPVASASIAQVYRARLVGDGPWVAVKVQRPGLDESLLADLDSILVLSGFFDRLVPPYHRSMVHRVAEEYAARARAETDFTAEARAIDRFADVLASVPEFAAPGLFRLLCTPRLLVMEWIDGERLDHVATPEALAALGFAPDAFCRSMLKLQLSMAYEHGFVHGDTHPGNLLLAPGGGRITLIDFGLHGQVPRALRDKMLEVVTSQVNGRVDQAVEAFVQVLQPERDVDLEAFKVELRAVMAEGAGELREHRLTEQLVRGLRVGARHHLRAQSDLFMVVRNLTLVEGIVLRYCPTMDVAAEVKTIASDILRRKLLDPRMHDEYVQLMPQVALSMATRPRLAERLLALERVFVDSKNLGDFLRHQDVLREPAPQGVSRAWVVAALATGVALGLLLDRVLG
jgi:ubiquinone biosynthesis protein